MRNRSNFHHKSQVSLGLVCWTKKSQFAISQFIILFLVPEATDRMPVVLVVVVAVHVGVVVVEVAVVRVVAIVLGRTPEVRVVAEVVVTAVVVAGRNACFWQELPQSGKGKR